VQSFKFLDQDLIQNRCTNFVRLQWIFVQRKTDILDEGILL